ncbi:MAG: EAL domain-containing protein [Clostridiales Family XIII bacterium]|jgi:lactose/cellobiose-specific phosphotransferase system IIC component|nr:EAL domain-containing protein [Clostridiales Family XIII bacterium]
MRKAWNLTNKFIWSLTETPTMSAIRSGFIYMMPVVMIGSLVVAFLNLPLPPFQDFMVRYMGEGWKDSSLLIYRATMQVMALTAVICISYALANEQEKVKGGEMHPIYVVLTAFASYVAFIGQDLADSFLNISNMDSSSMFAAVLISVLSVKLFMLLFKAYDRVFKVNDYRYNGNIQVRASFHVIVPVFLTILAFSLANEAMRHSGLDGALSDGLADLMGSLFSVGGIAASIAMVLVTQLLWFFGIHGGNVFLEGVAAASGQGAAIGGVTKEFLDVFVYFGGAGSTLGLIIALFVFGERRSGRKLAKFAVFPGLLNINEPLIYGIPIILNPAYFIPFFLTPAIVAAISGLAVFQGLVPEPTASVGWTTPIFLSGYLSTGSMKGVLLQFVCLVVAFACYAPFVRQVRLAAERQYKEKFVTLTKELNYYESRRARRVLGRNDEIGAVARSLAAEIGSAIMGKDGLMHLEYQPKMDGEGRVLGAEALLRWNHETLGFVSPITILSIADEARLSIGLGQWVIRQAIGQLSAWSGSELRDMPISINLSPSQLVEDKDIIPTIRDALDGSGVSAGSVEFELTENEMIEKSDAVLEKLRALRDMGASISIDDFGMGHSSLRYLHDFSANIVKLDASLVQSLSEVESHNKIVAVIIELCDTLGIDVVAEGVETEEQLEILKRLGGKRFQGFYFSRALTPERFEEFARERGLSRE